MSLNIKIREIDSVTIFDLDGTLDTNTSPQAEDMINESLKKGTKKMIIDLDSTKYISSAGLRVFLSTAKKIMANSGTMMLASPNKIVKDILHVSGFNTIIEVRATVEEALHELNSNA
ncbi:MAG: anti-sigma factor antagonist [Deltaproteobacteria bacterium]|jgi:anti-anti-sigma factor|nr:anti-sigma factor antagonist [Deltaproteobacteria bacterium]